jgi:acyl-CoA oxidase
MPQWKVLVRSKRPWCQVLDYTMQQYRLLPLLATTFAFQMTAAVMQEMMAALKRDISSGDASALPEAHATSSGLKAVRRWGGHGLHARAAMGRFGTLRGLSRPFSSMHSHSRAAKPILGLRQVCTRLTANGIEEARKTCGGHGYMVASGFPELLNTACSWARPSPRGLRDGRAARQTRSPGVSSFCVRGVSWCNSESRRL